MSVIFCQCFQASFVLHIICALLFIIKMCSFEQIIRMIRIYRKAKRNRYRVRSNYSLNIRIIKTTKLKTSKILIIEKKKQ